MKRSVLSATASQPVREGNLPARSHYCLPCQLNAALLHVAVQALLHDASKNLWRQAGQSVSFINWQQIDSQQIPM